MRAIRVTRYRCDFCGRSWSRRPAAERHERHCFKRSDRVPYLGELTHASRAGEVVDFGLGHFAPGAMDGEHWYEWVDWDPVPEWWPGPGKIWNGESWERVEGWSWATEAQPNGCAGGGPPIDSWPVLYGASLADLAPSSRIPALTAAMEPARPPRAEDELPF
jgi:hypothetical protein